MHALKLGAVLMVGLLSLIVSPSGVAADTPADGKMAIVVMDPLAAPLSCPCVEGYAQRKYETLVEYLEPVIDRKITLVFAESLSEGLKKTDGNVDVIIGKHSVVRADAKLAGIAVHELGRLTGPTGSTTQTGLIVVAAKDPAQQVKDLAGYRVIFGPADCEEKHQAAIQLLTQAGISVPEQKEIDDACSDGACKVLELADKQSMAAVISSYAAPLLEGCGTIKKGDLRVVGETEPVPFIAAFVNDTLPADQQQTLQKALLSLHTNSEVCTALESLIGFVAPAPNANEVSLKKKAKTVSR